MTLARVFLALSVLANCNGVLTVKDRRDSRDHGDKEDDREHGAPLASGSTSAKAYFIQRCRMPDISAVTGKCSTGQGGQANKRALRRFSYSRAPGVTEKRREQPRSPFQPHQENDEAQGAIDMADELIQLATAHLRQEEGVRRAAYKDHLGYLTIGVGRLIDDRRGGGLSNEEIDYLLANDIAKVQHEMAEWPAWQRVKDDPVRATALVSMCFQMGAANLAGFKNTLAMIAAGRWADAAQNMLLSKWATQTPARARRAARMIETGVLP